jgi:chromate reductase, NAD(P)H dehydrogenase (quinone)
MKVLGISGSLRRDSHNTALLRAAAEHAPAGVEIELWDGLKAVPPYSEDDDGDQAPAAVTALRSAVAGADAVLFATPEYNHSVPGALKNALDWVSRPLATNPLRDKPVAVVGASAGMFGAVWAQAELRKVLAATGARVVDRELAVGRAAERIAAGVVGDDELRAELGDHVAELAAAVAERRKRVAELPAHRVAA